MRKKLIQLFIVIMLLLDFAALDDITTGHEPDYLGEYAILIISAVIFFYIGYKYLYKKNGSSEQLQKN